MNRQKNQQLSLLKKASKSYGGTLLKKRKSRIHGRPLDTRHSLHIVLRSSQATGAQSFKTKSNSAKIQEIVSKFSLKYGILIISLANVGNHLHFHIRFSSRRAYYHFIRAVTGAIAMAVSGINRWTKADSSKPLNFWDYRPFTRVVRGFKDAMNINSYIEINQLEGLGLNRDRAQKLVHWKLNPIII